MKESHRNSKRFHTSPEPVREDELIEGFGDDDEEMETGEEVEEYKIILSPAADAADASEGPKLPWTMAKFESLRSRKTSESSTEPPQLLRCSSVQSLLANLHSLGAELHARRAAVEQSSPPRSIVDEETCADASRDFAALVKSVLKMEHAHARQLIETGVSVNMALREEHKGSVHFSTLLHAVCDLPVADSSGQIQIIQLLLEATANINPRDSRGLTPLMCACRQKNVEVVKLLLSHGARVQPCDTSGHNCLNWAAALREEAEPLTCYSPRAPLTDDEDRSSYLVELLLVALVQEQLAKRAAPQQSIPSKRRASFTYNESLKEFSELGPEEELQLYSEALGKRDSKSFPPLRMAVMQQNVSAALVMMACGAAPIWLHDAVRVGSLELVHALLHFDADPAKQDSSGASSIDTAVQLGTDWEIVEVLRENVHKAVSNLRLSESSSAPSPVRRISITSVTSGRSPPNHPRSPSSRSISFMRSISPKDPEEGSFGGSFMQNLQRPLIFNWMPAKSRKIFESNAFQCIMFCMLAMALYLPDIYAITDAEYYTLDVLLVLIFVFFTLDAVLQVIGIGKAYILSFFCLMDIIGTLSLIVEFSAVKTQMQQNSLTQNSVVMRATRASKIGARAGRLTRLVKLMRFLPFLRNRKRADDGSTAKVISSKLISRVSSIVACLIIFSVQVLPLPGSLAMPSQDLSIQMWTAHLQNMLEEGEELLVINEVLTEFRAFYERTSYKPYSFLNGTEVLWQSRGPSLPDRSMRIEYGAAVVLFDFTYQIQLEAGMNMIVITSTIFLMVIFSLLISRAVSKHALTPLEILLMKVRKIGRLIWLQVESLQVHLSKGKSQSAGNDFQDADETVLLKEVLSKIGVLSAVRLMRPDEDAQALAFLGVAQSEELRSMAPRETLAVRLQTVIQETLETLEVENITTWRFNPLDFEDTETVPLVCAKLLSTCIPYPLKAAGVTEMEISAFSEKVQAGYSKTIPYHNFNHAVDTMHSVYVILQECRAVFSGVEVYTLLMCAAAHDIGHPGFSNEFLVQTRHELALRYNDSAPLENMHTARLFEILRDEDCDILGDLDEATRKDIRKMSIEAILHTDNSCHFNEVKALQMIHEVHDEEFKNTVSTYIPGDDQSEWPVQEIVEIFGEKETHDTIRNVLLHFADISNSMKPFTISRLWADLVLEEFFFQGDKMKELGLPVPALNDRQKTSRPTSQIGFIEFIVSPLVFTIVKIVPPLAFAEQAMMGTVKYWFEQWASSASPSKSEYQQMVDRVKRLYEKATFAKQPTALFKRWKSI